MLTLLKIIIFGGSTVITPSPINISENPILIEFEKPLSAITEGASINIDVTPHITSQGFSNEFKEIDEEFPKGCVKAILKSKQGEIVTLIDSDGRLGGKEKFLNLGSESGVPTGAKYVSIEISSCKQINNTVVTWYNYSK